MVEVWWIQMLGTGLTAALINQLAQWFIQRRRDRLASRNAALTTCVKLEAYAVACAEAAAEIHAYLGDPKHEMEPSYSIPDFGGAAGRRRFEAYANVARCPDTQLPSSCFVSSQLSLFMLEA